MVFLVCPVTKDTGWVNGKTVATPHILHTLQRHSVTVQNESTNCCSFSWTCIRTWILECLFVISAKEFYDSSSPQGDTGGMGPPGPQGEDGERVRSYAKRLWKDSRRYSKHLSLCHSLSLNNLHLSILDALLLCVSRETTETLDPGVSQVNQWVFPWQPSWF